MYQAGFIAIFIACLLLPVPLFPGEWKEAAAPRVWSFPKDHGSHPQYRTEWWYFTGNLIDREARRYGYHHDMPIYGDPQYPWEAYL